MLDFLRNHWLCFTVGFGLGYAVHFCPLLSGDARVCTRCNSCVCDDCSCVDCGCRDGICNCDGCAIKN
jgi:hypothetical protein